MRPIDCAKSRLLLVVVCGAAFAVSATHSHAQGRKGEAGKPSTTVVAEPPVRQVQAVTIDSTLSLKVQETIKLKGVEPVASVILLAGGNGVLNLNAAGATRDLQGNFLIRAARLFLQRRLNVAMIDAEPASPSPGGLTNKRLTSEHAEHLGNVIALVRKTWPRKSVWLVGTSNGTLSAFNAAARLQQPPVVVGKAVAAVKGGLLPRRETAPDGLVLTSSVTQPDSGGETGTVLSEAPSLASIAIPTLVMWHANDKCGLTPATGAMEVLNRLSNVAPDKKAAAAINAGQANVAVHACSAFGPHGYNGAEAEAVNAIAIFIAKHSGP